MSASVEYLLLHTRLHYLHYRPHTGTPHTRAHHTQAHHTHTSSVFVCTQYHLSDLVHTSLTLTHTHTHTHTPSQADKQFEDERRREAEAKLIYEQKMKEEQVQ